MEAAPGSPPSSPLQSPVDASTSTSTSDPAMIAGAGEGSPTDRLHPDSPAPFQSPAATTPDPLPDAGLHTDSAPPPPSPLLDRGVQPDLEQDPPSPSSVLDPSAHRDPEQRPSSPDPSAEQRSQTPAPDEKVLLYLGGVPAPGNSEPLASPPLSPAPGDPLAFPSLSHAPDGPPLLSPAPGEPWVPIPPAPPSPPGWAPLPHPISRPPSPARSEPAPRATEAPVSRKAKRGAVAVKDASLCPTCKSGGRNLVVCIDGTSNQFSKKNTNVVELYSRLLKDNAKQVTFYNSGIGTYARPSWRSFSYYKQVLANKLDLAFALRFDKIILSAYAWLADNYVEGDRIFLFGFSRGAYQVRALSAMIHRVGLIHKGNADQIPLQVPPAYELYAVSNKEEDSPPPEGASHLLNMISLLLLPILAFLHRLWNAWDTVQQTSTAIVDPDAPSNPSSEPDDHAQEADAHSESSDSSSESQSDDESEQGIPTMQKRFKKAFARDVKVHFVGVWDTVSSVGLVRDKTLPGTTDGMLHVCYFRHALALHERRVKFLPEFVRGGLGPESTSLRDKVVRVLDSIAEGDPGAFDALSPVVPVLSALASTAAGLLYAKPTPSALEVEHVDDADPERPGQPPRGMSASLLGQKPVIDAPPHTKEVWFPGSHSDIGGGARPNENMRKFGPALRWMSFEARLAGLKISKEPRRWDTELPRTNSLTPFWKLIELLPVKRLTYDSVSGTTYRPHLWAKRPFQSGQLVYDAVSDRTKKLLRKAGLEVEDDPYLGAEDFLKSLDQYILNREILSERDRMKLQLLSNGALGQQQLRDLSDDISGPLSTMLGICKDKIDEPRSLSVASTIQLLLYGLEYSFDAMRNSRPLHAALEVSMAEDTWTFPRPLRGHAAPIRTVVCTHGGALIVSGAWDDTIRVWDTFTGESIGSRTIEGKEFDVDSIAVSPDGKRAVMTPYQPNSALKIWDLDASVLLHELVGHADRVYCAAFSPDGRFIASGSSDGIILWDSYTGQRLGNLIFTSSVPTSIFSLAFSNDGQYLAAGDSNCIVQIWHVETQSPSGNVLLGHNQWVRSVMFSPDDKRLVSGSDDGSLRIWRMDTDTREAVHVLTGHSNNIWAVAFSPKGKHVASASGDGSVRVWNADTGKLVGVPLEGHNSDVRCVAFSPDGTRVVSGADDGTIRIWDRMPTIPLAERNVTRDLAYPPVYDYEALPPIPPPAVPFGPVDPAEVALPPSEAGDLAENDLAPPPGPGDDPQDYEPREGSAIAPYMGEDIPAASTEDGGILAVSSAPKDADNVHDTELGSGVPPGVEPESPVSSALGPRTPVEATSGAPHMDGESISPVAVDALPALEGGDKGVEGSAQLVQVQA
ncbi:hypothetical protein AURDEDRAFT_174297 [Auricularia subglabra TFB-10046 SS5]|nr:hypothetical protein AURDEDRAFT_174297 [Auricularia subglabra TFB-10046 SS5]